MLNSVTGDQTDWLSRSWLSVAPIHTCLSWKARIFGVEARWRGAGRLQVGGQDSRQARGQGGGDMGGAGLGMGLGGGVGGCRGGVGLE